jgi:hypothetical protein
MDVNSTNIANPKRRGDKILCFFVNAKRMRKIEKV